MLRHIFISLFLLLSLHGLAQQPIAVQDEARQLKKIITQHHINPKPVNDQFSAFVFDHLLHELDPEKLYFTQQEITELSAYKNKIDDDLNTTTWNFLPAITQLYKRSLLRTENLITLHTQSAFDFNKKEILLADTNWAENEAKNASLWYLNLKFETLNELGYLKKNLPEISDKEFILKKEPDARQRTKRSSLRKVSKILNHPTGYENHVAALFLRSISLAFDPHSAYFSTVDMENFMASLSTQGFYFGINVDENDEGEIVITQLTPGGPAWKSGEIHAGDVIQQIRWAGGNWVDVEGMSKREIDDLLLESNRNVIEFLLKQTGGVQKTVALRKEKIEAEENIVKSFILEGEKKIGYVALPGFYADWGEKEGSRCANDVAREILKLKKENIDGLVLDVRYNGGGSLNEAVAMGGIFIDAGPMGVLRDKPSGILSVKDMNRGTVYDGPLVLLVNGLSASASEFLAAALQDYHRAVIVGSRTYGKATGQEIFPLQPEKAKSEASKSIKSNWGFSSITTMKIYRITGKTAQRRGVTPDIVLPDLYDFIDFREDQLAGALPSDSLIKKTYYTPLDFLPIGDLADKSKARVAQHAGFRMTKQCSKKLAELQEELDTVSLTWVDYKKLIADEGNEFGLLKEATAKSTEAFKIGNHAFERQRMEVDPYARQINDVWTKNLLHDISLEEAFYIICDYIAITSTK